MSGKYTFWKLLKERVVEIPVIQRDYAQGRKTAETIRKAFLSDIHKALVRPEYEELDMNFVYGSTEDREQFIPIDGQQRLTTLFLLHVYMINAAGRNPADFRELKKFRYTTRVTSTYFCEKITEHRIENPDGGSFRDIEKLRRAIIDNSWFGISWLDDPTVSAMLNTLDDIHRIFRETDNPDHLLDLLQAETGCPLVFYYLDLGEYKLEDSIYIKMNARGKPLTDYENFKARLEQFLREKEVKGWEEMAGALDREWTAFFWSLVSEEDRKKGENVSFDSKMMNFITAYIFNEYACYTAAEKREELRDKIKELFALSNSEFTVKFKEFSQEFKEENGSRHRMEDSFVEMFRAFDLMVRGNQLAEYAPENGFYRENQIFSDIVDEEGRKLTPQERVMFYAWSQFLLNHEADIDQDDIPDKMTEWLRVAKHLITGQYFNGHEDYVHVIQGFHRLAEYSDDIVKFLSEVDLTQDSSEDSEDEDDHSFHFNRYIFREECLKARLMRLSEEWDQEIRETESNAYLDGQIYAVLEFAGITDELAAPADWDSNTQAAYLEAFRKYSGLLCTLFVADCDGSGNAGLIKNYDNVFRRVLLTKGDYSLTKGPNSSFLVNKSDQSNVCTWKRLLRPQRDKGNTIRKKRGYLKELLDDPWFDISDVQGSCEKIISANDCPDPEYRYFITIPEVMDYVIGATKYYKKPQCLSFFRNDYGTKFLLGTTQLNGYNMDYYKYALLCVLKRECCTSKVDYEYRSSAMETINQPITLDVPEDGIYRINWEPEKKLYRITGGRDDLDETRGTLEDMVQFVKDRGLL